MKTKLLFLLLVIATFIGCKKDPDDVVPTSELAVSILSLNRSVLNGVEIIWKADKEKDVQQYELQGSVDSVNFTTFSTITPTSNAGGTVNYNHVDASIMTAKTFYRIKATTTTGIIRYSNIATIRCDLQSSNIIGRYRVTAVRYKADASSPEVDIFATFDACEKDDYVFFNSDNTNTFQDVGIICSPPSNGTGTWMFMAPNMILLDGEMATITVFNCSSMTLTVAGTVPGELTTFVLTRV